MKRLGLWTLGGAVLAAGGCPSDTPSDDGTTFTSSGDTGLPDPTTGSTPLTTSAEDSGSMTTTDGMTSVGPADTGEPATGTEGADSSSGGPPPPATCGNNVIEGDEVCDLTQLNGETCESLGAMGGQLGCLLDCSDYNMLGCFICGNDIVDMAEDCETVVPDGTTCETVGFPEGGNLACGADCLWDTSDCQVCGDDIRQGAESCDGLDLGGEDCASLGLQGGTLGCTPGCVYDFSACDIAGIPFGDDGFYAGFALTPGVLPCDDISATGTATGLTDDSNQSVPIGFTFPFYQVDFTDANIQSNGTLRFGDNTYLSFGNNCLPTATNPSTNTLYVFWDDLNPSTGAGEVYYETLGPVGSQRFVVQWDTANFGGDAADLMRFQAVLHEATGQIDVCYVDTINAGNTANSGAEATAGIQMNSMTALQYSCDMPSLVDGTMLMYIPI